MTPGASSERLFLFLGQMGMGGIEVLQLKLVGELIARGHKVMVAGRSGELSHLLAPEARNTEHFSTRLIAHDVGRFAQSRRVTIISMHPWELVRAAALNRELSDRGYDVSGFHLVTHSRAFFFDTRMPALRRLLRWAFFRSPRASTYFMNIAARDAHQAFWKVELSSYPVLKLALNPSSAEWQGREGQTLGIVSVGRLVPFKGYNRAAPRIVRALRDTGVPVTWDIWGDGPDEAAVIHQIEMAGAQQWIQLKGLLPYEDFDETVSKYDLFVGMGTALLEAARMGMPAITAVEGAIDDTYGFLHETPLDSVGDRVPGASTRRLHEVIRSYAELDSAGAAAIGEACRTSAQDRSSSIAQVVDAIERAESWRARKSDWPWLMLGSLVVGLQKHRIDLGLRRTRGDGPVPS